MNRKIIFYEEAKIAVFYLKKAIRKALLTVIPKLVHNFTVAENIVLGLEDSKYGFLKMKDAIVRIEELSKRYKLRIDPYALIEDISVGMQQRVEILKMLYLVLYVKKII